MKAKMLMIISAVSLVRCSSRQNCPSVGEESVSVCRAEAACGKGSFAVVFGTILSGMGAGMGHSDRNLASENYNGCVDRNLDAQKANAH